MKRRLFAILALVCEFPMAAAPLLAHHGVAAYDPTNVVTVKGSVLAVEFANPHVEVLFDVKDDRGNIEKWVGEAPSPNMLTRQGWTRKTLNPGDHITVIGLRSKKGLNVMLLEKLVLSSGREINPRPDWDGSQERTAGEGAITPN